MYPSHTTHHCKHDAALCTAGLHPAGRKPGPVAREQPKWNKVRLEKPRKIQVKRRPGRDSAGGHNILLQYRVVNVTHLMMNKATMGPQWKTLSKLLDELGSFNFLGVESVVFASILLPILVLKIGWR